MCEDPHLLKKCQIVPVLNFYLWKEATTINNFLFVQSWMPKSPGMPSRLSWSRLGFRHLSPLLGLFWWFHKPNAPYRVPPLPILGSCADTDHYKISAVCIWNDLRWVQYIADDSLLGGHLYCMWTIMSSHKTSIWIQVQHNKMLSSSYFTWSAKPTRRKSYEDPVSKNVRFTVRTVNLWSIRGWG